MKPGALRRPIRPIGPIRVFRTIRSIRSTLLSSLDARHGAREGSLGLRVAQARADSRRVSRRPDQLFESPRESVPVIDDGPPLSLQTAHRLCCDGSVIPIIEDAEGYPLHVRSKTRTVPSAMRRALERREGGYRIEPPEPGATSTMTPARFFDPRGWMIEAALPGERSRGNVRGLFHINAANGIRITPKTALCSWDGKRPDFDHIIFVLFQHRPHVRRPRH